MARERYLRGVGEDTIHANEITLKTGKEKRQNWWFYHKVHVIAGVLFLAMAVSIVWSIVSQVEPDYTIALLTSYTMPETGKTELERCIAAYADDRNGDGRVKVLVSNYVFSGETPSTPNDAQQQQAEYTKFAADCTAKESMIFLHDETAFDLLENNFSGFFQYNDGTPMQAGFSDYENSMRPWSDFSAFADFQPETESTDSFSSGQIAELYGRLRVSVRSVAGGDKKVDAYHEDNMELYHRLETGKLPDGGNGA